MKRVLPAARESFLAAINADPEFCMAARYWNGSFRLTVGSEESYIFRVRDGSVVDVNATPTVWQAYDFEIAGPAEGWGEMMASVPRPFYQDIASAVLRHGFRLGGDVASFFAYHGALRRVVAEMRRLQSA